MCIRDRVLSAVEGSQAQTEPIWDALEALGIPVLLLVNKVDRRGADSAGVCAELQEAISDKVVRLERTDREGEDNVAIS